jgi:outer membrane immunogenic protein
MRKLLLATTALAALVGTPAFAADMGAPVYKAPPPPAPIFSWTGFYVGLNGGYGWGHDPVTFSPANAAANVYFTGTGGGPAVPGSVTTSPQGGLFGGQIGYNYQWSNFVAGIETDFDWADIRGTGTVGTAVTGFAPFTTSAQQKLTSLGTFRGRLGFAADRVLFYGTGGLAYGRTQLNTSVVTPTIGCGPAGVCAATSSTQWQTGWTAGAGVEYAFAAGWSGRVEYLHYDLGSHTQGQFDPADVAPFNPVFNSSATFRGNIVRGGINYRFGG